MEQCLCVSLVVSYDYQGMENIDFIYHVFRRHSDVLMLVRVWFVWKIEFFLSNPLENFD
jgi:hypothetical protein